MGGGEKAINELCCPEGCPGTQAKKASRLLADSSGITRGPLCTTHRTSKRSLEHNPCKGHLFRESRKEHITSQVTDYLMNEGKFFILTIQETDGAGGRTLIHLLGLR